MSMDEISGIYAREGLPLELIYHAVCASGANLFLADHGRWETAYDAPHFFTGEGNVPTWAVYVPGDFRYCMHHSDRAKLVNNAKQSILEGASGVFLNLQEIHYNSARVDERDFPHHRALIEELLQALGEDFKGFVGERWFGDPEEEFVEWGNSLSCCIGWSPDNGVPSPFTNYVRWNRQFEQYFQKNWQGRGSKEKREILTFASNGWEESLFQLFFLRPYFTEGAVTHHADAHRQARSSFSEWVASLSVL